MAVVATDILVFPPVLEDTNNKPIAAVFGTLAFDNSYVTNGMAITVANMREVKGMLLGKFGIWNFEYDAANKKIKAYVGSTGVEVGNGVDLSTALVVPYMAWGNP